MPVEQLRSFESNQRISCGRELTDLLHGDQILLMEGKHSCMLLMRLAALCDESHEEDSTAQQNAGAEIGDVHA